MYAVDVPVARLFAIDGSGVDDVAFARSAVWPATNGVTFSVTVAEAPDASVPSEHVIVGVPEHEPMEVATETKVVPLGTVSTTFAAVAGSGPAFVATIVYVSCAPTWTGDGE